MYLEITILAVLLGSHVAAFQPALKALRSGRYPSVVDCGVVSVFIYYDLGILLEAAGVRSDAEYFLPFFSATPAEMFWPTILIALAPWALRLGALIPNVRRVLAGTSAQLRPGMRLLFFAISAALLCLSLYLGLFTTSHDSIWTARSEIGNTLGDAILLLYLPLYLLVFFLQLKESSSFFGTCYAIILVAAAVAATLFVGQRTLVLMPPLVFAIFKSGISVKRAAIIAALAMVAAAALLPIFKWQFSDRQELGALVASTLSNDFYRAPVLLEASRRSASVGTNILPYPGAGYVYSALFFVPRPIAQIKGHSTAQWFTAFVANETIEDMTWGFGLSAIDELMLNFGKVLALPGIILYGLGLSLLDRLSSAVPTTVAPTRLLGVWVMGYHLPALLLLFGAMTITCTILQVLFACRVRSVSAFVPTPLVRYRSS